MHLTGDIMGRLFNVMQRTRGPEIKEINGKRLQNGQMIISDPGEAREIDQELGKPGKQQVIVTELGRDFREGHTRTVFSMPAMPWKNEE